MTENMITVALIVGDPGHEGLQLDEGSLAAAARMIEAPARPPTAGGTRAGGAVCGASTSSAPAPRISKEELQTIWAGKLESVIWRPVGRPRSSVSAEGSPTLPVPARMSQRPVPVPAAVFHPVLRHLPFLPARAHSGPPGAGDGWSPGLAPGPRSLRPGSARSGLDAWSDVLAAPLGMPPSAPPGRRRGTIVSARIDGDPDERSWAQRLALCGCSCGFSREAIDGA